MLRSAAFASNVVASMPTVLPLTRPASASCCSIQVKNGLVRLEIDQPPSARNRRVVRRRLRQHQAEKLAQRKRIGDSPRDRALGVQPFEVTNQQQPEVASWQQART